jgi:hypothetical protein
MQTAPDANPVKEQKVVPVRRLVTYVKSNGLLKYPGSFEGTRKIREIYKLAKFKLGLLRRE